MSPVNDGFALGAKYVPISPTPSAMNLLAYISSLELILLEAVI